MTGRNRKKVIAAFFFSLLVVQDFYPAAAYALTSGPSQPEMQKFSPAGADNMVDLFTGRFKYDIPLMDVGGYPLNLTYHSGEGIEDEASWVGVGWSLNPGAVNRNMRGIPDDFTGDNALKDPADVIQTVQHRKEMDRVGGKLKVKGALLGWTFGSPSLGLEVYKDNYYGIGAALSASLDYSIAQAGSTALTAGLDMTTDSRNGVTVEPSLSLEDKYDIEKENNNLTLSGSFSYNTRSGLESVNLGTSFNSSKQLHNVDASDAGKVSGKFYVDSWTNDYSHTYVPFLGSNSTVASTTFSFDIGPQAGIVYGGIGGEGYITKETNTEPQSTIPAYGYLHYTSGIKNKGAMLDFNREKDGPYIDNAPAIPVPVATQDYFEATSQTGAEQFRPFYNGNYIVWDRPFSKKTNSFAAGLTIGGGDIFITGGQLSMTNGDAITQKWSTGNYIPFVNPSSPSPDPNVENVYFKRVGEQTLLDKHYYDAMWDATTQKVAVFSSAIGAQTNNVFKSFNGVTPVPVVPIIRQTRDMRSTNFSFLTAAQATQYGLDKTIAGLPRVDINQLVTNPVGMVHKPHHISEITVTEKDGKRRVYGIPVYSTDREEVSMSVNGPVPSKVTTSPFQIARRNGLVTYTNGQDNTANNVQGRDNIYTRKIIPPYATGYLLTGILSPDYVDRTGDGITDDDLGTAIKFSYQRTTDHYHWRAPYDAGMANYSEGFQSDQGDDKGNYIFGTKELWYLNSVTSKTEVAVFYVNPSSAPRQDGLGVLGENGGQNSGDVVQELDSIRLFSTADLAKNGVNAVPIKVVHFQYDYSLVPGVPNNSSGGGKLTLRKVWFTFGNSSRGQTNPYQFSYDMRLISSIPGLPSNANQSSQEKNDQYTQRQTDRWGTYRQSYFTTPSQVFNNSEFPYSIQTSAQDTYDQRLLADRFASKWQLNSIATPTGGIITVNYESDDYSYVQDQKAMMMCQVAGVGSTGNASGLPGASLIYVHVPVAVTSSDAFVKTYLTQSNGVTFDNFYYKMNVDLDAKGHNEYVLGYAGVPSSPTCVEGKLSDGSTPDPYTWGIPVIQQNGVNPIALQSWQLIQTDLPQFAYPNYDNSSASGLLGDVAAAVRSIVQAFINLRELFLSFNTIAKNSGYANTVDLSHSLVRLNYPVGLPNGINPSHMTYGKLGGGARVQSIELNDNWKGMSGAGKTVAYGIQFDYTTSDDQGNKISSGVASYEPEIGNEENPFRQPVDYTQRVTWGSDRYHFMEKPFGESYFPAASVGYSQVTATPYGVEVDDNNQHVGTPQTGTGYSVSQFYTAKDFPTQADFIPLEQDTYDYDLTLLLFAARYTNRVATTQGFKIVLNDMHGKQKAVKTYDNSGSLIASVEYFYNVSDPNVQQKTLNNTVPAMDANGNIQTALIGTDPELVTDLRESSSSTTGHSVGVYPGGTVFFLPFPFAGFNYNENGSTRGFNSASTIKIIRQYGLLQEVRTMQNGSTLTADNLLWDGQTGDVLLTRNQNEFNDYTYTLNYPAFRAYDGMSSAYQNTGTIFSGFSSDVNGVVTASNTVSNGVSSNTGTYTAYLSPGDELVDIDAGTNVHGWIIQPGDGTARFIDATGNFINVSTPGMFMVVRPGRRNVLDASAGSVITMVNPLIQGPNGYILQAGVEEKVLDAKAASYKDEWGLPVPDYVSATQYGNATDNPPTQGTVEAASVSSNLSIANSGFMDYYVNSSGAAATCEMNVFEAQVTIGALHSSVPTRGYLDFGGYPLVNLPARAIVSQVTLQLTAAADQVGNPTFGQVNSSVLRRVTQWDPCNSGIVWTAQPLSTTTNQVQVSQSSSSAQNYTLDITGMYNDWVTQQVRDNQDFALMLMMGDEQIPLAESMIFDGAAPGTATGVPPLLTVYYYIPGVCTDPVNYLFNPYYNGVKGNWRPYYSYAYQVNRVQTPANNSQNGGTDIRHSGYYSSYTPFWMNTSYSGTRNPASVSPTLLSIAPVPSSPGSVADPRWVWGTQSIYYDEKGNEIESVDALGRYSAVLFGYQQSLATGVARNARHNEIAVDGFEDYYFSLPTTGVPCPLGRHFDLGLTLQGASYCDGSGLNCIMSYPAPAHTGNYSLHLGGTLTVSAQGGSAMPPSKWVGYDANGHAILLANELAKGFGPILGQPYLLSFWVYDGDLQHNVINGLTVTVNNANVDLTRPAPLVEGWKQVNYQFKAGSNFSMQLRGGGNIYIDDMRVLPFNGEMKTFVYDDQSLRLMGQLDENNFGILYEYDEEGAPIRVKKETERGMMTVKENRQSFRKQ
jgi:hypothetical protein